MTCKIKIFFFSGTKEQRMFISCKAEYKCFY